ncbi:MAG: hypothetical protein WDO16_09345 [Bacteroidota bacterium]
MFNPSGILIALLSLVMTMTGYAQGLNYPDDKVVEYVNLDAREIQRQKEFRQQGLQALASVVLPEG